MAEKKDNTTRNGVIGGATAVAAAPHATRRLLGYHVVRHGTSNEAAAGVKKTGFDPKRGGSGAGTHAAKSAEQSAMFRRQSANKVHVTKHPLIARMFAGATEGRSQDPKHIAKGKVLKARLSHQHWKTMKEDPHMGRNSPKWNAATTHHKIPAHQVIGGAGDKGVKGVVNKNTLRKYYKDAGNHGRILRGLAIGAVAAHGAATAAKAVKHKLEKKASLAELAKQYLEAR